MLASVSPPIRTLSCLRKTKNAYARSPRWSSEYRLTRRRKELRVRSSAGQVGSRVAGQPQDVGRDVVTAGVDDVVGAQRPYHLVFAR